MARCWRKLGNGGKGIAWDTKVEVQHLKDLNGVVTEEGPAPKGMAQARNRNRCLRDDPDAGAGNQWRGCGQGLGCALSKATGREHAHLAKPKEDEKIRFRDIAAQPRKIISSPTWSGIESEEVCYNAGYTNVHELIPWRTI